MDIFKERLEAAQLALIDPAQERLAPMVMWGGLLRLCGAEPVIETLTAVDLGHRLSTWRTVWLTESRVIFSEATKAMDLWTAYSENTEADVADEISTWVRRRHDIARVELTEQTMRPPDRNGRERQWRHGARVVFTDGLELEVPLFEKRPCNERDRERLEAFLDAVVMLRP